MDMQLKGKKALVTAASKGIGRGVAEALAMEGAEVAITSSKKEHLEAARLHIKKNTGVEVKTFLLDQYDLTGTEKACGQILRDLGGVDILVANGPGPKPMPVMEVGLPEIDRALDSSLRASILLCRALVPGMIERKFGRVIYLTSSTAKEPEAGMGLSNICRAAVISYAKTLSREVAGSGITVNSILTGGVLTDRTNQLLEGDARATGKTLEQMLKEAAQAFPVGYIATPEQFAQTIVFLASPRSGFLNGVSLPLDGGLMRAL